MSSGRVGEPGERGGVARRRLVEALAAGEAIGPRVRVLPDPVVGERPALELADPDVVEIRVDDRAEPRRRGSRARAAPSPARGGSARSRRGRSGPPPSSTPSAAAAALPASERPRSSAGSPFTTPATLKSDWPWRARRSRRTGRTLPGLMRRGDRADIWLVQRHAYPSIVSPGRAAAGFACVALASTALRSTDNHCAVPRAGRGLGCRPRRRRVGRAVAAAALHCSARAAPCLRRPRRAAPSCPGRRPVGLLVAPRPAGRVDRVRRRPAKRAVRRGRDGGDDHAADRARRRARLPEHRLARRGAADARRRDRRPRHRARRARDATPRRRPRRTVRACSTVSSRPTPRSR